MECRKPDRNLPTANGELFRKQANRSGSHSTNEAISLQTAYEELDAQLQAGTPDAVKMRERARMMEMASSSRAEHQQFAAGLDFTR